MTDKEREEPIALPYEAPATVRRAGLLLPVFSLPRGTFGQAARDLLSFLEQAGLTVWQMLPLGPTHADGSPYQCLSSFALNPEFLDTDDLRAESGFQAAVPADQRRYGVGASAELEASFERYRKEESAWLNDYALFVVAKELEGGTGWWDWPGPLRSRQPETLADLTHQHAARLRAIAFEQFLLDRQWRDLRREARRRGIRLFGDLPIFVAGDSADVWAHQDQFQLDEEGQPLAVAGVPPDYFSDTGQRWGNPLFDYDRMARNGYAWWQSRFARHLELYDWVRIDHFRGLAAYWAIDASADTAVEGEWVPAPGEEILDVLMRSAEGHLPLVAEDLGVITPDVVALRERFKLPGMKILQFAFDGGEDNAYRPEHHVSGCVVYTGTHDNDTTAGWWESLDEPARSRVRQVLEQQQGIDPTMPMPDALVESALGSVANLTVVPVADFLGLGSEARINVPGTTEGNWRWRLGADELDQTLAQRIRGRLEAHGRLPDGSI
ncbi:4-alpha-glucanotransferase [Guyparkeria sp. 1SP6A2]|nr:4-alpha-glucanotransferase [Guyparkeria sp. 1SP6A2]